MATTEPVLDTYWSVSLKVPVLEIGAGFAGSCGGGGPPPWQKIGGWGTFILTTFSHTIVETVVRERVAVLTSDALSDDRFEAGQSIRIQQIRSAMCVPLWNRENVIGALHVDTPLKTGTFTSDDLDLLTALGNFAAVAIERARLQGRVAKEERIRERLARYHSPGVVEEIVSEGPAGVEKVRWGSTSRR